MGYTNSALARIQNDSGVSLKSVTLHHQYSDDPDQGMNWHDVAPGATTSTMTVGYNTGFIRTGQDYWWVQYTLPDGSTWVSPGKLMETLHGDDDGTTKTFIITGSILTSFQGSTMQLSMEAAPNYNSWAAIAITNDLPVAASVEVTHAYSDDSPYQHRFPPVPAETTSADVFIVYFNTGFIRTGSDHWNVSVQLDIPPYDNAPASAFAAFTNATSNKGCMLEASDNGKVHVFSLYGNGVSLGIESGGCTDGWATWNGYNALGFVNVKNAFPQAISTLVLTHQYSDDTTWRQTRGLIPADGTSPWMVVEFNIGLLRTGLDYWNVYVYCEDGTWYQNATSNKECMLSSEDAVTPSTFTVSGTTFSLSMNSGSCTDSMDSKGTFSPAAGRDVNKPYNQNAFIGSHNAYANFADGFWYAQQTGSIATQLGQGATTLLLDIWYDDGDIYLEHANLGILQPFVANQKLSDALRAVSDYLALQSRDPVTIIFEDSVDAAHQDLIKQAFVTSGTWNRVFNPTAYGVATRGWPTLAQLFALGQPIVVMTSNRNSPDFAYQWACMSENVYGDASLDQSTWLDHRSESQPLDQLPLCALNHFPTWSVSDFTLTQWIARANTDNATDLLKAMVDACNTRWHRYPNYINADFWEVPDGGLVEAITYLNQKLQGTSTDVLRFQHGQAILTDIDHE